jgi:hypothetical protein
MNEQRFLKRKDVLCIIDMQSVKSAWPSPVCGRDRTVVRVIRDPIFFHNAARLDELLINPPR